MKKTFTCSFLFVFGLIVFGSCSKDVKAPGKAAATTASTTSTYTNPQTTQNQSGHTCGGSHSDDNSGDHY